MWILKGSLLGIGIFFGGVIVYAAARLALLMYQTMQFVKQGGGAGSGGAVFDVRLLFYNPYLYGFLVVSLVVGLMLVHRWQRS